MPQIIAGARGAIDGFMIEVAKDHIRHHVVDPTHEPDPGRARGAGELIDAARNHLEVTRRFTMPTQHPCMFPCQSLAAQAEALRIGLVALAAALAWFRRAGSRALAVSAARA